MKGQTRRPAPMWFIEELAARVRADESLQAHSAGTPHVRPAPNGLADIMQRGGQGYGLGISGGLTLTKNAVAFTAPRFQTSTTTERDGYQRRHYATVDRTTSRDATHDCFYPGPGDHLRPGMTQRIGTRTYNHYWRITPQISNLIRQGEQEHLNDALRAYELTYQLVANTINGMAAGRFGPADSPFAATQMAAAELARRLPSQLGTDAASWARVLNRLLPQTRTRDTNGWHALDIQRPQTIGNRIIHSVAATPTTRIDRVPSSQVVNY